MPGQTRRFLAHALLAALALMPATSRAAELVIPGSGNPEYVLNVLAREFNARQNEHRIVIPPSSGSAGAIRDVLGEKSPLGRIGRPLKDAERAKGLDFIALGRDAVVFVAGAGVSARSVTSQQMIDAFTGKLTDWKEIGARAAPIRVIGREISDASRQSIASHIRAFQDLTLGPGVKLVHLDPQVLELLDRYDSSLGMLNRSALHATRTPVVVLALEGVEPSIDNLASGKYPIWTELGLIQRSGSALPPEARAFLAYIRSPDGARILRAHGIAPAAGSAR